MTIKVLIVDDSLLFRNYLCNVIQADPELEVIDCAINGKEALDKLKNLNPDVITMDVNMPIMDGITTVRKIMAVKPTPILMLSSITLEGAQATFNALEAGAVDFLPKDKKFTVNAATDDSADIIKKIKTVARCKVIKRIKAKKYDIVLIGASTGGPMAVQTIIRGLPGNFPVPIVVVQHMPANFTKAFADRINNFSSLTIKEAEEGDRVFFGNVYIAPGGKQLTFNRKNDGSVQIEIKDSTANLYYRPCIDLAFESAAAAFKGKVLSLILTGMGEDGMKGVKKLKQHNSTSWIQDENSSVVYGMPQAVLEEGLADKILAVEDISRALINEVI